jgi:hypothetical protein
MRHVPFTVGVALIAVGCASQQPAATVVHHHYYGADAASQPAQTREATAKSRNSQQKVTTLDVLWKFVENGAETFRAGCDRADGEFSRNASGDAYCHTNQALWAITTRYGEVLSAGFVGDSESSTRVAKDLTAQLGSDGWQEESNGGLYMSLADGRVVYFKTTDDGGVLVKLYSRQGATALTLSGGAAHEAVRSPVDEPDILDSLASLLRGTMDEFREYCAKSPAGELYINESGVWTCWQPDGDYALATTFRAGSAVVAGFTTKVERLEELAATVEDKLGSPDTTSNAEVIWERDTVTVKLAVDAERTICGIYVYRRGDAL